MNGNSKFLIPEAAWKARIPTKLVISGGASLLLAALCALAGNAQTSTVTTLNLSAGTLSHGSALTLTATVMAGSTAVSPGVINFCDPNFSSCTGPALIGTAQLTTAGTASMKFIPGIGTHSYKAVFVRKTSYTASSSSASSVTVTGRFPSTTTIASSGAAGNYTLTGTVATTGLLTAPSGSIAFQDTTNGNYALGASALGSATQSQSFLTGSTVNLANGPRNSASGDFNRDGIPDLAIAGSGGNVVYVLLGNGDGTFTAAPGSPIALQSNMIGVAVGDFNNDGKLDIVATSYGSGSMAILLGNGDGTFQTPSYKAAGFQIEAIAVGDLNHDGNLDVVIANQSLNQVEILLGNGAGAFTGPTNLAAGSQPYSISLADLNGDGSLDIVVGNATSNSVYVFLNDGSGGFTAAPGSPIAGGTNANMLATGDFRGIGKIDVVVADSGANTVNLLLGNGDGTFQTATSMAGTATGTKFVTVGDYNGDGKLDFATCDPAGTIGVYLGKGDGTFQIPSTLSTGGTGAGFIITADFDGDGVPDFEATLNTSRTSVVKLSKPTETAAAFISSVTVPGSGTHAAQALYSGDTTFSSGTSSTTGLTASKITTALTLYPAPTGSQYGQQVVLSAVLNPYLVGSLNTNGETVTFKNGGVSIGTGLLSSGVATLNITSLSQGIDSLTAVYPGDTNYLTSTSSAVSYTVVGASTVSFAVANQAYGVSPFAVSATSNSAGAFTYSVVSGPATILASTVTITGPGTVVLQASQAANGNYLASSQNASFLVAASPFSLMVQTIQTIAGQSGVATYTGDGGQASAATLNTPVGMVFDLSGNLYIADSVNNAVRMVTPGGIISTFAGNGTAGYTGDGGRAAAAQLNRPNSLVFDASGSLYISDTNNFAVRQVTPAGVISTYAGSGIQGYAGDGGSATSAKFSNPLGLAFDSSGNLYIVDSSNAEVRKVTPGGIITAYAGNHAAGYSGDGGQALSAKIDQPKGIAFDSYGNLYIADRVFDRVRKVAANGIITSIAGNSTSTDSGDGGPAAAAGVNTPVGVTLDNAGNVYVGQASRVRWINPAGTIATIAGTGTRGQSGDGGPAASAMTGNINAVIFDSVGQMYISDNNYHTVRQLTLNTSFPATTVNRTSASQSLQIVIEYASAIQSLAVTSGQSDFILGTISGCTIDGSTVNAAGTVCTLSATFNPQVVGDRTATLTVVTGSGVQSAFSLRGTGVIGIPTILLATSSTPASYGSAVAFTATLPSDATGTVTFLDGASSIGTGSISGGTATLLASSLAVGTHSITATWSGNANYISGTSSALSQTVVRAAATIALNITLNPSTYGDSLLLTASFTGPGVTPTGAGVLMDGLNVLATVPLNGSAMATYPINGLVAASHVLSVIYSGDTNYF